MPTLPSLRARRRHRRPQGKGLVVFGILSIIQGLEPRPKLVLLENVAGLYFKHKELLKEVLRVLRDLGYHVRVWLLNSRESGVPQNRLRTWIIAVQNDALVKTPRVPGNIKFVASLSQGFVVVKTSGTKPTLTPRHCQVLEHGHGHLGHKAVLSRS